MTVNYRCTKQKCHRQRITLRKPKEQYAKDPVCLSCGTPTLGIAKEKERTKKRLCRCDGYPYPHSKGSTPWCRESKREPTEYEFKERYNF